MIKITNLSKSYGDKKVLDGLNCTIKTGSIYGLVGANGAGKSTLLRIINDIINADSGEILVDDRKLDGTPDIKQRFAFVSDDLYFFPNYTLLDTAKFYKKMYEFFDINYFKSLAKTLKLNLNEKVNSFSKGMKRQCAVICAIATNADYMFFDETFDGVDPIIRNVLKKMIINQMEKKETTIVMTSHNLRELEDICDNLGLLYEGGILFESEIDSLKTNMFKIQISPKEDFDKDLFKELDLLNYKKLGSVATLVVKGEEDEIRKKLEELDPVVLDFLPLTLEEIFIYEMEVLGYEFEMFN